jgi:LPXTG-site transpeptidase (sortase) family protein
LSISSSSESSSASGGKAMPLKDLYEIGEIPPLGHVPKSMYAWAIRKDRHGPPDTSMQLEVVPIWSLDSHDVLVLVMAAGVNYNGVWAGLGEPISPLDGHKHPFHIAGSDASGIVWAVGSKVKRWKVGDEVVINWEGKQYKYRITKLKTVKPNAIEVEDQTSDPQLTIYTCTLGGAADGRVVVVAKPETKS